MQDRLIPPRRLEQHVARARQRQADHEVPGELAPALAAPVEDEGEAGQALAVRAHADVHVREVGQHNVRAPAAPVHAVVEHEGAGVHDDGAPADSVRVGQLQHQRAQPLHGGWPRGGQARQQAAFSIKRDGKPARRMQGAFPVGVDWRTTLDPPCDEEAQRQQRSDEAERELSRLARLRNPNLPNVVPARLRYTGPFPPDAFFYLPDGTKFFILREPNEQSPPRQGQFGHYLVTTVQTLENMQGGTQMLLRKPFIRPVQQASVVAIPDDAPGMVPDDGAVPPNMNFCRLGKEFVTPETDKYWEVGLAYLTTQLEQAEELDKAFAKRIEGLGNLAPQVCWDCQDPDYDPHDLPAVKEQFLSKYMASLYDKLDAIDGPPVQDVAEEAVHKHKALCQAWAKRHYKTLTPAITAPAEALTSEFFQYIEPSFHPEGRLSRVQLSRLLMRHPETSCEFASCLHYYNTNLEQTRGGRNASYKQMTMTSNARIASYKRMGDLLGDKLPVLSKFFSTLHDYGTFHFDRWLTDWHLILGQMPQIHRHFSMGDSFSAQAQRNPRNPAAAGHVPPWRFGR